MPSVSSLSGLSSPRSLIADTLTVNDVSAGGDTTKEQGSSGQAGAVITAQTVGDDANGCNATGSANATITLTSSDATKVNFGGAASASKTTAGCGNTVTFDYDVPSNAPLGDATITARASGGKSGSTYTSDSFVGTVVAPKPTDSTGPVITPHVNGTLGNNGWYTSDVAVTWDVVDEESAISSSTGCEPSSVTSDTGASGETFTCTAQSDGGKSTESVTVKRDATAPEMSLDASKDSCDVPGNNGWCRGTQTAGFSASDATSGLSDTSKASFTNQSGTEGSDVKIASGPVTDAAGNTNPGIEAGPYKIDKTAPTLKPSVSPNPVLLNGSATADPGATDALSGVESSNCDAVDTSSVGANKSVGCSATNKAGNAAKASASYGVQYKWGGFLQPINNTTHQTGTDISTFKAGSTVPAKFQLKDANDKVVQASGTPQWLTPVKGSATTQSVDEPVSTEAATTAIKWDATAQQYVYNWSTKGLAGSFYYKIGIKLDDGQTYYQNISLR